MRRAVFALLGTAIGTTLLIGARLGAAPPGPVQNVATDTIGGEAAGPGGSPSVATTAAPTPGTSATPGRGTSTAPTARKSRAPAPAQTTATNPTTATGPRSGTFAGAASTNKYGTIKVTITVSAGKITNISASYPTSPDRTASINQNAIPKLRQAALAAQSAKIDTVSGATYTSDSYRTSLQSALDRAGA